jgi:hypothetical protein
LPFQIPSDIILYFGGKEINVMGKIQRKISGSVCGESQANRRYLAFAKKAEEDGYQQVAKLFQGGCRRRPFMPIIICAS